MVAPGGHAWLLGGACVVAQGGAWLLLGGVHGCSGGMHGCLGGSWCAWLLRGVCVVARGACMVAQGGHVWLLGGMRGFFDEIQSMSERYTSYWNAFLFSLKLEKLEFQKDTVSDHCTIFQKYTDFQKQ